MSELAKRALDMATQDIVFNRIRFGKKTTVADVRRIFDLCVIAAKRA